MTDFATALLQFRATAKPISFEATLEQIDKAFAEPIEPTEQEPK